MLRRHGFAGESSLQGPHNSLPRLPSTLQPKKGPDPQAFPPPLLFAPSPLLQDAISTARDKERRRRRPGPLLVPGFCLPKALSPVLPIYLQGVLQVRGGEGGGEGGVRRGWGRVGGSWGCQVIHSLSTDGGILGGGALGSNECASFVGQRQRLKKLVSSLR